jgi:hypothetical protein
MSGPLETGEGDRFFLRESEVEPSDMLSFSFCFNCVGDGGVTESSGAVLSEPLLTG